MANLRSVFVLFRKSKLDFNNKKRTLKKAIGSATLTHPQLAKRRKIDDQSSKSPTGQRHFR